MEKREKESRQRKKMGLPSQKQREPFWGEALVGHLLSQLNASPTMLAGMLSVNEKTLQSWKKKTTEELASNSKSRRLLTLYEFVCMAAAMKVEKTLLLSLLHEPLDPSRTESGSLLSHIVREPTSSVFKDIAPRLIRDFVVARTMRHSEVRGRPRAG